MSDDYVNELNTLLKERTGIDFEAMPEIQKEPFLGGKLGCPVRELVVLLVEIEKTFHIKIPEKDVLEGRFDCYNNVKQILKEQFNVNGGKEYE